MIKNDKADRQKALEIRRRYRGILGVEPRMPVRDKLALSLVYTPGVAEPCRRIERDPADAYRYTSKKYSVALVSNGTDFLDMGRLGPAAMLPVLEGEAAILSALGRVSATPICVDSDSPADTAFVIRNVAPTFGAVAVLGMSPDDFEEMKFDLLDAADGVPVVRYEDVIDGVFKNRSELDARGRFAASHMVMPGYMRALLAARPRRSVPLAFYAAARELENVSLARGASRFVDFTLTAAVARACADAFVSSGEAAAAVNSAVLTERIMRETYESPAGVVTRAISPWSAADLAQGGLDVYARYGGSITTRCKLPIVDRYSVALVAAPGSLWAAEEVAENPAKLAECSSISNSVAVVTDGTAVLGLGDIGSLAGMPVMEGKCVLFNNFAGVDAVPICLATKDADEIVRTLQLIGGTFGGINLEDIAAPKCFEIERRVGEAVGACVFHDDQHGTATVVLAGLINALKLTGRSAAESRLVINGAGAAGLAVTRMLLDYGFADITVCDRVGAIYEGREEGMNDAKRETARHTNRGGLRGGLSEALVGADIFVGVSAPDMVTPEMVKTMKPDPIIFALANPVPEIMPDAARSAGARVIATGRSDFANQVNNALVFPALFRAALDTAVERISPEMKIAAAEALAGCVPDSEISAGRFIPSVLEMFVHGRVAAAVAVSAEKHSQARRQITAAEVRLGTDAMVFERLAHALPRI